MRGFWLAIVALLLGVSSVWADERPCDPTIQFRATGGSQAASSAVSWRAEPQNTASRVVMVVGPDGRSSAEQAKPGRHKVRLERGVSTVVLVFYDARGRVICTAITTALGRGAGGGAGAGFANSEDAPSSGSEAAGAPTVVVLGRYVVVFYGATAYAGDAAAVNKWVSGDTFDGRTVDLTGYIGLEIYGNGEPNTIWGSDLDDVIVGGDESCSGYNCNTDKHLGDTIHAGGGDDRIYGGNEDCRGNSATTAMVRVHT